MTLIISVKVQEIQEWPIILPFYLSKLLYIQKLTDL